MLTAIISSVSYLSLLIFLVVNCFQFPEENCTAKHAWAMIGIRAMCQPHPTIEVMMDHIVLKGKKLSTVKRLFPSHVTIHQCLGDCAGLSSSKCLPHKTELVPVPIAVTTCTDDESICTQTCTVVHLLNHTTCHAHCGCDLDYRRCKGEQVFLPDECRCRCPKIAEREECNKKSRVWDPELCRCLCPPSTFAICEEDQVYDFREECRCISRDKLWSEAGSTALRLSWEMAIIMVLSCLAFFLVTLAIVMAKKLSVLTKAGFRLPLMTPRQSNSPSVTLLR